MPINFQPAEPIRPDVSQGYGAAEQFDRSLPVMQRYQQGIADAYLQAASLRQRAVQASSALQLQGAEQTHALDQRGYEANLHAQMQQQQMAHQSDMQAQHAQLQDQLAANQLSRGEQLRLQRLQEARGQVQDMVNSGTLTADEGRSALTEIQTGINPLQQRHQRFQQQMQEFQYKQMQQQAARQDQLWDERTRFMNGGLGGATSAYVGDNGDIRRVVRNPDGSVDHHATQLLFGWQYGGGEHAANPRGGGAGGGAANTGGAGLAARNAPSGRQWHELSQQEQNHIYENEITQMRAEQRAARESTDANVRDNQPAWMTAPAAFDQELQNRITRRLAVGNAGRPQQPITPEQRAAAEDSAVRLEAERAENLRNREALHSGRMQLPEFQRRSREQGQLAVAGRQVRRQQQATGTPVPLVQGDAEQAADRPFTADEIGAMNMPQRQVAERLNGIRAALAAAPVTPARRQELAGFLNEAQGIAAQYGNVDAMPHATRRHFDHLLTVLSRTPQPRPPAPPRETGALDVIAAPANWIANAGRWFGEREAANRASQENTPQLPAIPPHVLSSYEQRRRHEGLSQE